MIEKFIDIVNNGKVDFTEFTSGKTNDKLTLLLKNAHLGKGDGYNFLDRYQRLTLANELLAHIIDINTTVPTANHGTSVSIVGRLVISYIILIHSHGLLSFKVRIWLSLL